MWTSLGDLYSVYNKTQQTSGRGDSFSGFCGVDVVECVPQRVSRGDMVSSVAMWEVLDVERLPKVPMLKNFSPGTFVMS